MSYLLKDELSFILLRERQTIILNLKYFFRKSLQKNNEAVTKEKYGRKNKIKLGCLKATFIELVFLHPICCVQSEVVDLFIFTDYDVVAG